MKQPKFNEGDVVVHTFSFDNPSVIIVVPLRYVDTDYGWDWVYLVKCANGSYSELYQNDLKRTK